MEWRLFADLAERTGERRVAVAVADGPTTARAALAALVDAHPVLAERVYADPEARAGLRPSVTVVVDGDPVESLDAPVPEDADLALLPPASGG